MVMAKLITGNVVLLGGDSRKVFGNPGPEEELEGYEVTDSKLGTRPWRNASFFGECRLQGTAVRSWHDLLDRSLHRLPQPRAVHAVSWDIHQ
jgi:hypothetical protein